MPQLPRQPMGLLILPLLCCFMTAIQGMESEKSSDSEIVSIAFSHTPSPTNDVDRLRSHTVSSVTFSYADGKQTEHALDYRILFKNTDRIGDSPVEAGRLFDIDGKPLSDPNGDPVIAETPDANSLLAIGDKLFLVTHYEYDWLLGNGWRGKSTPGWYKRMPMSMTLTDISQDKASGRLSATAQRPIDFSSVHGLWTPCFGSQTPWNSHLGSEEGYELFALPTMDDQGQSVNRSMDPLTKLYFNDKRQANPYHYGYITEVKVSENGGAKVHKHFNLGRASWEMAKIMPDGRTVYFGDDGNYTAMFMYITDRAQDLSAGSLYAAQWRQTNNQQGGAATLLWVKLGHAAYDEIKRLIDGGIVFGDMFDHTTPEQTPHWRKDGFRAIRVGGATEYLRLKSGHEQAAAFLESRRYAAYLGATTEFNKMEGVAVNRKDKIVYVALSYVEQGMLADPSGPTDHIRVERRRTGGVYAMRIRGGRTDSKGARIDSDWVATSLSVPAALLGEDISTDALGNRADPEKIANPDNLFFSDKMRVLFISEDSGLHVNNGLWAYHVDSGRLARILSVAAGAESTGLQVIDNLNGHAYVMSNAQHQGDWPGSMPSEVRRRLSELAIKTYGTTDKGVPNYYLQAPVGYIGGMPGL